MAGQILDGTSPAPIEAIHWGNRELAGSREKLFRSWVHEASKIRKPMRDLFRDLERAVRPEDLLRDGSRLTVRSANTLARDVDQALKKKFAEAEAEIRNNVSRAIRRASRAQQAHLESLGVDKLTPEQMKKLRRQVERWMKKDFPPGSGMNYQRRLDRIRQHHSSQVRNVLKRSHDPGEGLTQVTRDLRTGLTHTAPGRTPIKGGSAVKKLQRLMVSEESRLANEIERRVLQASGVGFAYWRLNPAHKWYGGQEICEQLAFQSSGSAMSELERLGFSLGDVELQGLYLVSEWPGYPHPFCKCFMEAWYPPEYGAITGRRT